MRYTVGAYVFSGIPKPFETIAEAVSFIHKTAPELSKETIEKHINPKIKEDESDKSGNVSGTPEESGKTDPKVSKGRDKPDTTKAT